MSVIHYAEATCGDITGLVFKSQQKCPMASTGKLIEMPEERNADISVLIEYNNYNLKKANCQMRIAFVTAFLL